MADAYICRRGGSSGGAGGSELVIVGGTTSPAKATHNTIWVDTPTEITSYVLAGTEPAIPIAGMVWITIGAGGAKMVAPVGDEWVVVYPMSAKQYVDGAWVTRTAKSYQNGEWVEWAIDTVLYESGAFNEDIPHFSSKTPDNATITYSDSYINMASVANKVSETYEGFGPINIAGFSRLIVVLSNTSDKNIYGCAFASQSANALKAAALAIVNEAMDGRTNDLTVTLDLSELSNAECYVYAGFHTNGDSWSYARTGLRVQSVKLEV